jgi:hypothetical protein
MSQNQIKILATLLMCIDHIGFILNLEPLRAIGRLSFPLFCWIFSQNWQRNKTDETAHNLMGRLMIFGCLSQIPYIILFNRLELNILFSFLLSTETFYLIRKTNKKILMLSLGIAAAQILNVSYGWFAIICPLMLMGYNKKSTKMWWSIWIIINIAYTFSSGYLTQILAVLTPLVIGYHNSQKDRKPTRTEKKFFYYFYPLHLAGLAAGKGFII